tara:strand:- start:95 stop:334 length:240 start_codon:yes stop_codon:yes gene_type:complete
MDIGTAITIGKTFLDRGGSSEGSAGQLTPLEAFRLAQGNRGMIDSQPLDPAGKVGMPQQINYDQTRQFWASLLTDYIRG